MTPNSEILKAAETAFVDYRIESNLALRPQLLINDYENGNKVLCDITSGLNYCDEFMMSVAFITNNGIEPLMQVLKELEVNKVKGRILTTDYLDFSDPKALKRLKAFTNITIKIYPKSKGGFHTKGFIFRQGDCFKIIVGSSNLTASALMKNKEWNIQMASTKEGEFTKKVAHEFDDMWETAIELTDEWISTYDEIYKQQREVTKQAKTPRIAQYILKPYKMQVEAVQALKKMREEGKNKALIISATGTGKTYLAGFDARSFGPGKLLFLVHREQILRQALESFKDVHGEAKSMGILSGNNPEVLETDFLFSTVQMMSKEKVNSKFLPDYFDYIIIDEVHKAGAESYSKIINYFKPKFLLGMTATPERPDGFNIFELFDYNIAYEIRLQQAMQEDMLCPFHYFGITELTISGEVIDDMTDFTRLISGVRVDNMVEQINFYGYSGDRVKGLIFCRRNDEAQELSKLFNLRGFQTIALSGTSTPEQREEAIEQLEQADREGGLDYIFTVDIFNEGVDVPSVNQVVMLRPTKSSIVFIQQLGRGLRKAPDKEFVVVIDFIGNYNNNFMIPLALSGDKTYNKDVIRKYIAEGNRVIPGCSTVNFDEIAKERIYASINHKMKTTKKILTEKYVNLKNKLGKIPTLIDFYNNGSIDPSVIFDYSKSYYNFLKMVENDYTVILSDNEKIMLECISVNIANGKRPHELLILQELMLNDLVDLNDIEVKLKSDYELINEEKSIVMAYRILEGKFWNSKADKIKYIECQFVEDVRNNQFNRCISYYNKINNLEFNKQVSQLIEYGLRVFKDKYQSFYKDTNLMLYQKYSRKDVCRLLNWDKDESSVMYGYKVKHGMCPVFVTYKKSEYLDEGLKYDDKFICKDIFSWMTRPGVNLRNADVIKIKDANKSGLNIELFVNKSDDEGNEFYYMGRMYPMEFLETTTIHKGIRKAIVNVIYKMEQPIRDDIFEYITKVM